MIKSFYSMLLLVFTILCCIDCTPNEANINNEIDFGLFIEEEMARQNIPATAILIFKEDHILYEHYYGLSQIEQNVSLQNDHLFLLASVSKVITATALLQLYDGGSFTLDDNINDFLPFDVYIPGYETEISFKMLLAHTSGIADGTALDDQYYYGVDSPVELDFFLKNYLETDGEFYDESENFHDFEPGSQHEYSNTGNALIALLVEEISGQHFNSYCKEYIFNPLDMTNSYWRLDEINQNIVQPYHYVDGDYEFIEHYTFTDYPNGGLRSNVSDMFKFLSAIVLDGKANNYPLLKPETATMMYQSQIPDIDAEVGLHLFKMDNENNLWGHDGGEQGAATMMAFNPSTKIGALIFSNQGEANLDEILSEAYKLGLILE